MATLSKSEISSPDLEQAFSYVEYSGLKLVLHLAKPLSYMTVA